MVKLRLLKIPEKKRQAILNQVEANLGNKLIEFVSERQKAKVDMSRNGQAELRAATRERSRACSRT